MRILAVITILFLAAVVFAGEHQDYSNSGGYYDPVLFQFVNQSPVVVPVPVVSAPATAADNTPRVAAALAPTCAECHTDPARKKAPVLFDKTGAWAPKVGKKAIWEAVKDDVMPPGPAKTSPAVKALVREWAKETK